MDKKKEIVDLSPQNSEYAAKIAAARNVQHPVGGAPMPKIPNLAQMQGSGDRFAGVQQARAQGMATLLTPEQRAQLEQQNAALPGVGSAYVANQPMARQVMQQPQQPGGYQNPPRPEGAGLSAQTAEQLAAVAQANAPQAKESAEDKMKKDLDDLEEDFFDYDEFGNRVKSLLANKERREIIEGRCEPMDITSLIVDRELRQVVPIIPGKYYPTYRLPSGEEDLEVKRILAKETTTAANYLLAKLSLMQLTCGLFAINGKPLAAHLDADGNFSQTAFEAKYKNVVKYPITVLADLALNYNWFEQRTKKLLSFDAIKDF